MNVITDPVLARIREHDIDLHDRIVAAISELSPAAAELACAYEHASPELMRRYQGGALEARLGLAGRPDLPADVAEALAHDDSERVRAALARNHATTDRTLALLATDSDAWVKRAVHRHANASEEIKAAVVLTTSPEELKSPAPHVNVYLDPATPPDQLRAYAAAAIEGDPSMDGNLRYLLRNPSLPDDVIPELLPAAASLADWTSLWERNRPTRPSRLWLSTLAFTMAKTAPWVLESLTEAGHPAGLITLGARVAPPAGSAPEALMQLVDSELLIRALWRELAQQNVVELNYWNDEFEGDKFFPSRGNDELLMDPHGPTQFIVGGWAEHREWIVREDSLSLDSIYRVASFHMEDVVEHLDPELTDVSVDTFAVIGIAHATEEQGMKLTLTSEGERAFEQHAKNLSFESNDYMTTVTVSESALPSIGYADTSTEQKLALAQLLLDSRVDPRIDMWGIANHFLMCLAWHPDTSEPVLDLLRAEGER